MRESQNTEWKLLWKDDYLKWICGFANAQGGKIYLGINDDGKVVGLRMHRHRMESLPGKILSTLGILCDVNLLVESEKYYIEIVVNPYDVPISYQGKYYYRSGSTKQILQGTALNDFLMRKSGKTWDAILEPQTSLDDLSDKTIALFKQGAIASQRLPSIASDNMEEVLGNLRLHKKGKLKRAAILLFGEDPREFYPTAYIKIGKFGASDSDLLSQEIVDGNIIELADKVMGILDSKYITATISYEGLQRQEKPEYPPLAIREILLNALVHRTYIQAPIQISMYKDKMMVWNEGSLPAGLTVENLKEKHPSLPKNPVLAEVCFKGGLIEAWGRGIPKVVEECKKWNLPEPKIELLGGGIAITLYKNKYTKDYLDSLDLSERQIKGLEYIKEHGQITNSIYQEINTITDRTARRDITELVEVHQLLVKHGTTKGAYYTFVGVEGNEDSKA